MDLTPEGNELDRLVVHHFSSLRIHCLHTHILYFFLNGLRKGNLVVLDARTADRRQFRCLQLLGIGEVEHNGRADQLSIDIFDLVGGKGTVCEIFVAIFVGTAADQSGEGKFGLGGI